MAARPVTYQYVGAKDTMAGSSADYVEFVKEQLAPIPGLASGRFFGGIGLSVDGLQFAMIMGNALYFAVDQATRPRYEKMGSGCFWYATKKGRVDVKKYYAVPADLFENQARLVAFAREAIDVARSAKTAPKRKSPADRKKMPGRGL